MSNDPDDVVRVAAGDMVVVELYKHALADEGIEGKVLGEALEASFGTAIPQSVELWVHRSDATRAAEVIRRMEEERGRVPVEGELPPGGDEPNPAGGGA